MCSQVKAKLTRTLQKELILPYATDDMIKASGKKLKKEPKKANNSNKINPRGDDDDLDAEEDPLTEDVGSIMDFI